MPTQTRTRPTEYIEPAAVEPIEQRMLEQFRSMNRKLEQCIELLENLNQQNSEHTGYLRKISRNTFKIRRIWIGISTLCHELMAEIRRGL